MSNGDGPIGTSTSGSGGQWSPGAQEVGNPGYLGNAAGDQEVGVVGQAGNGIGVYGDAAGGIAVYGDTNSGIGVVGRSGGSGAGVVGLGGAGVAIDGGIAPVSFPGKETVGVYGSVGATDSLIPRRPTCRAGCGVMLAKTQPAFSALAMVVTVLREPRRPAPAFTARRAGMAKAAPRASTQAAAAVMASTAARPMVPASRRAAIAGSAASSSARTLRS